MKSWLSLIMLLIPIWAGAADLQVQITDARNNDGAMRVYLYHEKHQISWLKSGFKEFSCKIYSPIIEGNAQITCEDLAPGIYALSFFHDENLNFKFDQNFLKIPKEGYGFSLNFKPSLRAPKFKEVQFEFKDQNQKMTLKTIY